MARLRFCHRGRNRQKKSTTLHVRAGRPQARLLRTSPAQWRGWPFWYSAASRSRTDSSPMASKGYRVPFLLPNEQAFKNQLRTSGNVLGCVFIAVSLVVLSARLWEAAESAGQKTLIALWAAFVCLVALVFAEPLVFRERILT